jgi:tetratricopeptide (TPR) repeat protein
MYAEAVAEARTEQVRELLGRERLVKADVVLSGLCELGCERLIQSKSPAELRKSLASHLQKLRRFAELPFPPSAPPSARIGRAVLLIQLDHLESAADLLRPLVPADDTATLLLATVYRDQERWAASDELYSTALEKLLPLAPSNEAARAGCITALEGLAFNARADRRPADAECVLKLGLDALPSNAAYFHFQLGKHYAEGGRHFLAVEHLETAVRLDAARYRESVGRVLQSIRASTPACMP